MLKNMTTKEKVINESIKTKQMKGYYILFKTKNIKLQLINNWHESEDEQWHLMSIFRKWYNGNYDYYFALFGFQLRFIKFNNKN